MQDRQRYGWAGSGLGRRLGKDALRSLWTLAVGLLLAAALLAADVPRAIAELALIEADGYSVMGDGPEESPVVAKERARQAAKRAAREKAGIYVKIFSETMGGKLTQDEIQTVTAGILEVKDAAIESEILGGIAVKYHCHITVTVDTSAVTAMLQRGREKLEDAVLSNRDQTAYNERNDEELADLKERYKEAATEEERQAINQEVRRNEEKFTASQWNEQGVERYSRGDAAGAEECYQKAIETDAKFAAPWSGMGWIHRDRGAYEDAIRCFQNAIDRYPAFAVPWNGIGYSLNAQGAYEQAIGYCQKAIELDPGYAAPWNNLGYAYDGMGEFAKAIECYRKAAELDPRDPTPWGNMGNTYDDMGEYSQSIESCQKAIEIDPGYAKAWSNLGYAQNHMEDYGKAIESCRKAIELDPGLAEAWNGLAHGYNHKGKHYKAIDCCRRALKLNPGYANAWNSLGYAYARLGLYRKSWEAYKKAVELAPEDETYAANLEMAKNRL